MNLNCTVRVDARGAAPPPSSKDMLEAAKEQLGIYGGMSRNIDESRGYAEISFDPHTIGTSDELEQICQFARRQAKEPYHTWTVSFSSTDL